MTTRKRLKRLVRARAAKTGESYTSALRHFREETPKERGMSQSTQRPLSRCTFCTKSQDQVKRLIAGPGVFICDECVMLCLAVIEPSVGIEGPAATADRPVGATIDPDTVALVRRFLGEALPRIELEEGDATPLADRIEVTASAVGIRVDVYTGRPGLLIGRGGVTAERLRAGLIDAVQNDVALNIVPM